MHVQAAVAASQHDSLGHRKLSRRLFAEHSSSDYRVTQDNLVGCILTVSLSLLDCPNPIVLDPSLMLHADSQNLGFLAQIHTF
jgi:hypothetical protein